MAIRRSTPSSASLTGGDLSVDILHTEDSVQIGDGTNLAGTFPLVGGLRSIPVANSTFATSTDLTGGTQKTKIYDPVDGGTVEIDDVGGEKALKVSVIASIGGGGGGTAATDSAAYTATASQFTPIGGAYDDISSDALAEGEMGICRVTSGRALHVAVQNSVAVTGTFWQATQPVSGTFWQATQPVSAAALPLPSGASTEATLGSLLTSSQLIDDVIFSDDAAFTPGTSKVAMIGAQCDETATDSVDEGDAGALRMTADRQLYVKLGTALPAGTAAIGKLASNSGVDIGDVDVTSVTCAAANAKVDIGLINGVTPLMGAGNTGTGSLRVTIATDQANLTTPLNQNLTQIGGVAISTGTGTMGTGVQRVAIASNNDPLDVKQGTAANLKAEVVGSAAHDSASPGVPIMVAARANNANPTAVAAGDVTYLNADLAGRLLTTKSDRALVVRSATLTVTNTTETSILSAGAAGVFHDVTSLVITNGSSVGSIASIRDVSAGTVQFTCWVPALGGIVMNFDPPLNQTTAASAWTIQMGTTATDTRVLVNAMKRIA